MNKESNKEVRIKVRLSEEENEELKRCAGTTFVIRVPFKIDLDVDKSKEQKDLSEKTIKGLHILLAEDNELNMEIAEFMFQNEGAEVTKAWNKQTW